MKKRIGLLIALAMVLCLAGCKEKEEKSKTKRPDMDALRAAEVGSYVFFGEYEQDNDASTGKEAIEWLVLDKQKDRMLVISRYGLDCQPYNTEDAPVTWETCSLRGWLNGEFFETAFISEEKNVIHPSVVVSDANPKYASSAGNDTMDRVFLLSIYEADRYFADATSRTCFGTPYCFAQGAYKDDDYGTCWWWLRSPGFVSSKAANAGTNGYIQYLGSSVVNKHSAVRPALWIDLSNGEKPNTEPIAAANSTPAAKKES